MADPFETYLKKIEADLRHGIALEHTYRPALEAMLEALAPGVNASNEPKHIACGAPDFIVERGQVPLGYLETKDIGEDLDKIEKTEQLKRYRASLHNLVLTDYLEFRWYVDGKPKLSARLATVGRGKKLTPNQEGIAKAAQLFAEFYQTEVPTVGTPKDLAQRMAALTKIIYELITGSLREEGETGVFHKQLDAFRHHLIPTLTSSEFADLYAQTMAYGLFAARLNAPLGKPFSRAQAYIYMPPANPFLRKLFLDVGEELDGTPVAPFLDDLVALLARADMAAILRDFGKRTRTEDPVVHFYESFLAAYDRKLRKSRGVYYTPEPVVQFIVNSVDSLLKKHFNSLGLVDPEVLLLDPATGTATFLYYVIRRVYEAQMERGQAGAWSEYVRTGLLPRLFGFELLMAPYAIAHLKLGLLLQELGYVFGKHERLGVYLTNTLEAGVTKAETLGLAGYLSEEGSAAAEIKNQKPIMVVLGNPPYSGHSANKGPWIDQLVGDYYFVDGKPLGERNPKWLQDDYVKFIRFAQWRIQQSGRGIVAFITNHGYLDNPTFRGMRQQLLNSFDELYVLDLHGNTKKREVAPDEGEDQNVFDIQQGVAILLAVKKLPAETEISTPTESRVYHLHLWGERSGKYQYLESNAVETVAWTELQPTSPFYLLVPQNVGLRTEYEAGWRMTDAMPVNVLGFQTHRDKFAIDFDQAALTRRMAEFRGTTLSDTDIAAKYDLKDNRDWQIGWARKALRRKSDWQADVGNCLYRPFDWRPCYFDEVAMDFPRRELKVHVAGRDNLVLGVGRQGMAVGEGEWNVVCCSREPVDANVFRRGGVNLFPLYLYTTPEDTAGTLFAQIETTRAPNLAPGFIKAISAKLGLAFVADGAGDLTKTFGPEDVFHYAYAVFHSPTYRQRYAEFLKIDFPRLPLTSDKRLFAKLVSKGAELTSLHLFKSPALDNFITTYPVRGDNVVERVLFQNGKVWINEAQYFGGIPENVWAFKVGGYQVCDKWLKSRKGRTLSGGDITHYQRIVVALRETMRLMEEIDAAIPAWPIQ